MTFGQPLVSYDDDSGGTNSTRQFRIQEEGSCIMEDLSRGYGKGNGVGSFDFHANQASCHVRLRMKAMYGIYIVRKSYALLTSQTFTAGAQNNLVKRFCSPTTFCNLQSANRSTTAN